MLKIAARSLFIMEACEIMSVSVALKILANVIIPEILFLTPPSATNPFTSSGYEEISQEASYGVCSQGFLESFLVYYSSASRHVSFTYPSSTHGSRGIGCGRAGGG